MFSVKNIQDKLKRRDELSNTDGISGTGHKDGEMVASGLLCPNCRCSFIEIEQLMQHVPNCSSQGSAADGDSHSSSSSSLKQEDRGGSHSSSSIFSAASLLNGGTSSTRERDISNDRLSSTSSQRSNSPSIKSSTEAKMLKLAQDNVRWKEKCDEQKSLIESLSEQLNNSKMVLAKKNKYIEKLESDILEYEERADDHMAIKNELSSLRQLVSSMSAEHESEVNDLLEKLHKSQENNLQLSSDIESKINTIANLEVQLSSQEPEELKCESCNQSSQTDNVEELTLLEESTEEPPLEKTEETDAEIEDNCNSCKTKECRINNLTNELKTLEGSRDSTIVTLQQQIEQLEAAASKGCIQCREYELQLKKRQKSHSTEVAHFENKVQSLKVKIAEQHLVLEQAEALRHTLSTELAEKKQELISSVQQMENLQLSIQLAQNEKQKLTEKIARMEELPQENDKLMAKVEQLEKELEEKKSELKKLHNEEKSLREEKEDLEEQLENVEKSLFQSQHDNSSLSDQLQQQKTELTRQIETLRNNISAVRMELSEKEEVTEEQLSRLNQNLTLLRNDLNSKEEEVADYECKVEKLQAELSQKTDETTSLKDSLLKINESFQAKNLEFDRLKTHYVELRASLEGAQRVMFELGREQQSLQVERARMFDRNWLPDHHVTHCLSCNKEFSATLRKHHCRCCGKIFCNDCSAKKASLPAHPTPVRVCNECSDLLPPASSHSHPSS